MPRNASGTYSLPAGNPVVTGTVIDSNWANPTMEDIAAEITDSLSRSGEGGMLVPLTFDSGSSGAPGIAWVGEASTGLYRAGTSDMRATIAGIPRMKWHSEGVDVWDPVAALWVPLVNLSGVNFIPATGGTILDLDVTNDGAIGGDLEVGDDLHVIGDLTVDGVSNLTTSARIGSAGATVASTALHVEKYAGGVPGNELVLRRSTGAGVNNIGENSWIEFINTTDSRAFGWQLIADGGMGGWTYNGSAWAQKSAFHVGGGLSLYAGGSLTLLNTGNTVAKQFYMNGSDELGVYGTVARGAVWHAAAAANVGGSVVIDTAAASSPGSYLEGSVWLQYTP